MALVLAAVGLFVYHRVGNELLATVDQTLVAQTREELGAHSLDADAEGGRTLVQLHGPTGRLLAAQPRRLPPMLPRRLILAARTRPVWRNEKLEVDGQVGEWRILGRSARGGTIAVLARSLDLCADSLGHLRHELLIFLPLALLAASLGGYALAAGALTARSRCCAGARKR